MDRIARALIEWLLGDWNQPGAGERALAWVRATLIMGIFIPIGTIFLGILISRFGWFGGARWIILTGILFGMPVLIVIGGGAAALADIIVRVWWTRTPQQRAIRILQGYFSLLVWLLTVEELVYVIGVFSPFRILVLGFVAGIIMILMSFAWDKAVGWGRRLAFSFQFFMLAWIFIVSIPSGFYLATVGIDIRAIAELRGVAAIDQWRLDETENVAAETRRRIMEGVLEDILHDFEHAQNIGEYQKAQRRLENWKKEFGKNGLLPRAIEGARR